jgi:hypothetical protein
MGISFEFEIVKIQHTVSSHCNRIRDADSVVLPCNEVFLFNGVFCDLCEIKNYCMVNEVLSMPLSKDPKYTYVYNLVVHTMHAITNISFNLEQYSTSLTCMDFLPTTQKQFQFVDCFSSHVYF